MQWEQNCSATPCERQSISNLYRGMNCLTKVTKKKTMKKKQQFKMWENKRRTSQNTKLTNQTNL